MDDSLMPRRDDVIEQLSLSYADGRFEVDELERRLALAHAARTTGELDALVTDLAPAHTTEVALVPARRLRVMLGSVHRAGPWAVPSQLSTRVLWGSLVLDLRDAQLPPGGATIDVQVTMGNLEVLVPPDVTVDVEATSLMANVEARTDAIGRTRVVRITGSVRLGNLEVTTLRHGESRREAHRRERWERRAHRRMVRHAHRRGLPMPSGD